jgi:hypothetical protein
MANLIVDHKVGDTWNGFSFTLEDEDTMSAINLTGYSILIQFRLNNNSIIAFEFKTSDGTITIPNPATGEFIMMPRIMNYAPNTYKFDVQLTSPSGEIETIVSDYWKLVNDISR